MSILEIQCTWRLGSKSSWILATESNPLMGIKVVKDLGRDQHPLLQELLFKDSQQLLGMLVWTCLGGCPLGDLQMKSSLQDLHPISFSLHSGQLRAMLPQHLHPAHGPATGTGSCCCCISEASKGTQGLEKSSSPALWWDRTCKTTMLSVVSKTCCSGCDFEICCWWSVLLVFFIISLISFCF